MPTGHRFLATDLHQFVVSLFTHLGSRSEEATLVADHLIAANLAGHDSHGVGMIPSYVKSHAGGFLQLNRHATVTKDAGAVVTLDGNAGFGRSRPRSDAVRYRKGEAARHGGYRPAQCASRRAHRLLGRAVRRRRTDLHSLRQRNRRPDGRSVPRKRQSLRHQPLCVVFPREGHPPLLLDYATSAIAFGKTRVAWHKGEAVAPGCLIDAEGLPTTDPAVMQTSPLGALLTFAQHKGYAPATLCEVLGGALSGGKPPIRRACRPASTPSLTA